MKTVWLKGLNPDQSKDVTREFTEAKLLRYRLTELVKQKVQSKRTESQSTETYNNPSWAFYQADVIGYQRALSEVLSLIDD